MFQNNHITVQPRRPLLNLLAVLFLLFRVSNCCVGMECPLCPAIGAQTISEEIEEMDVVVFATLSKLATETSEGEISPAQFRCTKILKGKTLTIVGAIFEVTYQADDAKVGDRYFMAGVDPPELAFNNPIRITKAASDYIDEVAKLGFDPAVQLEFYLEHLDSLDEVIAQDAYDEFARAPYADVIALKPKMDRAKIIQWIHSDKISANRRSLFFMMLGVCGNSTDLPMLESLLREKDSKKRLNIDSTIACYLTLSGEKGLSLIEELYFKNGEVSYSDTYSAVMAIRFHGTDGNVISLKKLTPLFHNLLDRPRLADLVIPDLARWEDWSIRERLVTMFKDSTGKESFIRVPVLNYLKVCPHPQALENLNELKEIDPNAFKRSNQVFSFGDGEDSSNLKTEDETSDKDEKKSGLPDP